MIKTIPFILILFHLLSGVNLSAQNSRIDSLKKILPAQKEDTSKAKTLLELSRCLEQRGDHTASREYADQALSCSEKIGYTQGVAYAHIRYGFICHMQGLYKEALDEYFTALAIFTKAGNMKGIADAYNDLGNVSTETSDYEHAYTYYQNSLKYSTPLGDKKRMSDSYNNTGNALLEQGRYLDAFRSHEMALQLRQGTNYKKGIADSYNNIGNVNTELGNYPLALNNYYLSLKIREELGENKGIADSYNNIGMIFELEGDYNEAIRNHLIALDLRKKLNAKRYIADSYTNLANVYTSMKRYSEAMRNLTAALELCKEVGYKRGCESCYNNMGMICLEQGDAKNAMLNYNQAMALAKELGNKAGMSETGRNLASYYTRLKNYPEARKWLNESLVISAEIRSMQDLKDCYRKYIVLDSASGNMAGAFANAKKFTVYRDSLNNEETNKRMLRVQVNFEYEEKNKAEKIRQEELKLLAETESRRQKAVIYSISAMLLLVIGFAIFAFYNYRQKKRINAVLEVQKKNIDDSIRYARRIQEAILPETLFQPEEVRDYFVLYLPKDVVSGDFYWKYRIGDELFFAAIDCTGHGVPGAMMSMLAFDILEHELKDNGHREPGEILTQINNNIIAKLRSQESQAATDGMDSTLCRLSLKTRSMTYAGAKNAPLVISGGQLNEYPVNRNSIGYYKDLVFEQHTVQLKEGDQIYLFSDGFHNQKGGPEKRKYLFARFRLKLLEASALRDSKAQKAFMAAEFENWKGKNPQRDDVLLMGIKV
jgi:tetratricopeptide (TPR) repeat protein